MTLNTKIVSHVFIANKNNPLGLFKPNQFDSKVYQLFGYFNFLSGKELNVPSFGNLPVNHYKDKVIKTYIDGHQVCTTDYEKKYRAQMENFGLDYKDFHCFHGNVGFSFLFKLYREPISFKQKFTNSEAQAIFDFLDFNSNVPEILSVNRLAKELSISASDENSDFSLNGKYNSINKDSFYSIVRRKFDVSTFKYTPSNNQYIQEEEIEESSFELNSDYKEVSENIGIDLFEIQKSVNTQAKRKGGFIDFHYKDNVYKIPKLPFMIWATKYASLKFRELNYRKTEYHNETWFTVSPEDVKTDSDAAIHTDWWIGAGFPLSVYNLFCNRYSHKSFNNALSEFAMSLVSKNTLDSVVFLAGKNSEKITGNLVIYPSSLDDFNEDDIIVLSHGGVEFDSFIKKACKNKKGAVIVETGNKVSHLKIVSNEYNNLGFLYRLIMLPNAHELLCLTKKVCIDPVNEKIIPI